MRLAPFAFILALATPATAQQGGIETFAAETLFAKGTRVSMAYLYEHRGTLYDGSDKVSDPLDRTRREQRAVASVDHGFTPDLTVSALVPFVNKQLDSNLGDVSSSGLGDMALLAKYRYYQKDWPRGSFNLAVAGGVETPTGKTDASDGGATLPAPLQPGSGSWDPFFALTLTTSMSRWRFDGLAFYKWNTEGTQNYDDGDFLALQAAAAYRFWFEKYPGPSASARLGLQWREEGQDRLDGAIVPNTGLDQLLARTGLSWHPKPGIDVGLAVDFPLHTDVVGQQLALDLRTILAVGFRF